MKEIQIEYLNLKDIKPYENNPRNNDNAVEEVAKSIKEFGFKVPIVIDRNNIIVTGHTRYKASQLLNLKKVPCIRANDLTKDQVKAFRLADNKVSELATWDMGKLEIELGMIQLDMEEFGFEIELDDSGWGDSFYGDERLRTDKAYNLDLVDHEALTNDFWQMPIIKKQFYVPEKFIGFNYAKTSKDKNCGVHFYIDDYQFERIWADPDKYFNILSEYECIISPDFSLYCDMPMPMKIWNTYRNRWIGSYYQSRGLKVIPNIRWDSKDTWEFCFQGIEKGSIISVSTVSLIQDHELREMWKQGMEECIKRIEPVKILLYGRPIEFDFQGIEVIPVENIMLEEWKSRAMSLDIEV